MRKVVKKTRFRWFTPDFSIFACQTPPVPSFVPKRELPLLPKRRHDKADEADGDNDVHHIPDDPAQRYLEERLEQNSKGSESESQTQTAPIFKKYN